MLRLPGVLKWKRHGPPGRECNRWHHEYHATPTPRRRWLQFSLRTMMVIVLLFGCGFGWLGMKLRQAREQREAVKAIRTWQAVATYDYELDPRQDPFTRPVPPGPSWVRGLLGDDFFAHVVIVDNLFDPVGKEIKSKMTDDGLVYLRAFPHLRELYLRGRPFNDVGLVHLEGLTQLETLYLDATQVTDEELVHLQGLARLKRLFLNGTKVTDAGVVELQKALPNVQIFR
jgi:hypothetical protein